jgi:hypothetical protein
MLVLLGLAVVWWVLGWMAALVGLVVVAIGGLVVMALADGAPSSRRF